jgi:hypothetical protein
MGTGERGSGGRTAMGAVVMIGASPFSPTHSSSYPKGGRLRRLRDAAVAFVVPARDGFAGGEA